MTTEEKARAYDEALEKARKKYNSKYHPSEGPSGVYLNNADLEEIFPELAESEDEKIRKEIIHYILYKADGVSEEQEHNWVTYLEKQKEQKPAECIEDSVKFEEGFKAGRESGLRDGQNYVLNNLDSYGLCKPAEWSGSFEENIRNLLYDKLTWHSEDGSMSSTTFIDDKTLKDIIRGIWFYVGKEALKYPNKELNVTEWSEEDEEHIKSLLARLEGMCKKGGI